ncbi:glyceraldehyde 3-phosphate dehydrogenase [Aliiruegeria haliotis]|uniref:Glyceraldehyde 3-phosphate dehydrogenase n=1 Tax=Aliiruegeria haliotis TaxID=1280846 RepID=A0A2T0RFK6_9RHOB|nr:glyceraldehyde 3-phosphate dehydrogenase NAD-binding domain-containing protein [Aliiruegeria haliotis]PRY19927.1 glyceraldehyde 3-phosphate dehydrogenase [Aliiruegeria haliotis]
MKVAINGFGRIGRTVLRQILSRPDTADIEVTAINDIAALETCAYLFQYDSVFGPYPSRVEADGACLTVGDRRIPFSGASNLATLDLAGTDVVLECTGRVDSREIAKRGLAAGARAVLVSGPSGFVDATAVFGAGADVPDTASIVSNSSCTTNAIAPLLQAIDATFGIERAHVTTIHCYTGSQPIVDGPRSDLARGRAGAESMVPTMTSAADDLSKVLPSIGPRTSVAAVRVPCLSVSAIDATLQLTRPPGADIRRRLREIAARSPVLGLTEDPCVSRDMRERPESLILALPETIVQQDSQLRLLGWYDNEWGFSARMIDMARRLCARR